MWRTVLILTALAALMGPAAQAQSPPGIYNELQGLDFKNDEFDEVISRSFGCPAEGLKRLFLDSNERRGHANQIEIPACPMESDLLKILMRVYRQTGDILPYLKVRGANCEPAGNGKRCEVQRDIITLSHTGDRSKGTKLRDLFTIDVFISDGGEPIRLTLTREGIGR